MRAVLFPLIWILQIVFLSISQVIGSYGLSLIFLSFITSFIMAWLGRMIKRYPEREALVQSLMLPKLKAIKRDTSLESRHQKTVALYKKYNYHPILALRSAFPLLLQLPFLFAAYHMLSSLQALEGVSFWLIRDLSAPDALLAGINILPILMTAVNILTALLTPSFTNRDRGQAFVIAGLFLVLLYNAASALLIYWTMNNLIFFVRSLMSYLRKAVDKQSRHRMVDNDSRQLILKTFNLKALLIRVSPYLNVYLISIVIYYFIQFSAASNLTYLFRLTKNLPLIVALLGLELSLLLTMNSKKLQNLKHIISASIIVMNLYLYLVLLVNKIITVVDINKALSPLLPFLVILSFLTTLIAMVINREKASERYIFRRADFLLLCLPSFVPGMHILISNTDYLFGWYYVLYTLVILALPILLWFIIRFFMCQDLPERLIIIWSSLLSALIISMPIFRAIMSLSSSKDIDYWIISSVLLILCYFLNRYNKEKHVLIISIFLILASLIGSISSKIFCSNREDGFESELPSQLQELNLTSTPNIYLLVYDGIPNERVFKIDNLPFDPLRKLLAKYNFTLYPDTYTLSSASLGSMASMLNISGDVLRNVSDMQDTYSGNSLVNNFLVLHGYSTHKLLKNYFTGTMAIKNQHKVIEYFPPIKVSSVKVDYFVTLLRGIFQGQMKFDTKGLITDSNLGEDAIQARKLELIRMNLTKRFIVNHYGLPSHSQNSGKCLPNETQLWINRFDQALVQMESDFEAINEYDPGALVIAIGDHGPVLTGDCHDLRNFSMEEITADMVWDRIGTMVAIRWPDIDKADKFDQDLILNQDIFAVVISYLCESKLPLELMPERTFRGYRTLTRPQIEFTQGVINF